MIGAISIRNRNRQTELTLRTAIPLFLAVCLVAIAIWPVIPSAANPVSFELRPSSDALLNTGGDPIPRSGGDKTPRSGLELDVELSHRVIGSAMIDAYLVENMIFVRPLDIFRFIHVHPSISERTKDISGFYLQESRTFVISAGRKSISFSGLDHLLASEEYVEHNGDLFLQPSVLDSVFHLHITFDKRRLRMELSSTELLPAEQELEDARRREGMKGLDGLTSPIPDKRFTLSRSWGSLGYLDWSLSGQTAPPDVQGAYNFHLGGQLAGGDIDGVLSGLDRERVDWSSLPWRWRLPIQSTDLIRTILVGRRAAFSNLALADSMLGFQVSNAYTGYRSMFTSYTISDVTEPDWIVELYINNNLASYSKADQTGYYKFVVPLSYGATDIRLRFLGPSGEIRFRDVPFRIPYTFLPPGSMEYTLTAGASAAHPQMTNSVAKLDAKLGVSTAVTMGAGTRYSHDSLGTASVRPFGNISVRLSRDALVAGEYYHGAGFMASFDVTTPDGFSLNAQYAHPFSRAEVRLDEMTISDVRRLQVSTPLPWVRGSFRLGATDYPLNPDSGNFGMSAALYLSLSQTTTSLSAYSSFLRDVWSLHPVSHVTGDLAVSLPAMWGISFRPSVGFDYTLPTVTSLGATLSRSLGRIGFVTLSATHNLASNTDAFQLGFGTSLSYAQLGAAAGVATNDHLQLSTSAQGAIVYDQRTADLVADNRPEVRYGGVEIIPFMDQNGNGQWDRNEPIVQNVSLEEGSGKIIVQSNGAIRVIGLEPYIAYYGKVSSARVENMSLLPAFKSFEAIPPANGFARVEIPFAVVGQIEGYVRIKVADSTAPLGGVRIKVQRLDGEAATNVTLSEDVLTFSNGEFYYLGLAPGRYRISPDPDQLRLLRCTSSPARIDIEMKNLEEGDLVEGLEFVLAKM